MAFSGLHVTCAYAGSISEQKKVASTLGRPLWSQTLATAGTTTNVSPGVEGSNGLGDAIFHIRASVDSWCAVAPVPDATAGARFLVPANEFVTVYTAAGDKLAWIAA